MKKRLLYCFLIATCFVTYAQQFPDSTNAPGTNITYHIASREWVSNYVALIIGGGGGGGVDPIAILNDPAGDNLLIESGDNLDYN